MTRLRLGEGGDDQRLRPPPACAVYSIADVVLPDVEVRDSSRDNAAERTRTGGTGQALVQQAAIRP